ncbi:hypothetical protein B0H12DRAFT_1100646 [Mycena haematopus]|nr:hypothetical protein B0H12DRAFT_1100646 [Mycena haematopus]
MSFSCKPNFLAALALSRISTARSCLPHSVYIFLNASNSSTRLVALRSSPFTNLRKFWIISVVSAPDPASLQKFR